MQFQFRTFFSIMYLGMTLVIATPASAVSYYDALDIGDLGGSVSGYRTTAYGINASGQVVGFSYTASNVAHAFITGANGVGMTDLGTLGGTSSSAGGINSSGQVVGGAYLTGDATFHSFITGANGIGMTDLSILGSGNGINSSGQVVGTMTVGSYPHAFITGVNGVGTTDLGTLGGHYSYANSINTGGQVAGTSTNVNGYDRAYITGPNGVGMTNLGVLGHTFGEGESWAEGINDSGQVAGWSDTNIGYWHAFITGPNGVGMIDLTPGVEQSSQAYAINAGGQVAGIWNGHAFITGANGIGITDLNSTVNWTDGSSFTAAWGINDMGQVIANATNGHAYLLTPSSAPGTIADTGYIAPSPPVPIPAAAWLLGSGLLGLIGVARRKAT